MKKSMICMGILVAVCAALIVLYFVQFSGHGEPDAETETRQDTSEISTSEKIRAEMGTPKEGGMLWETASDDALQKAYDAVGDWGAFTVFDITNNQGPALMDELRDCLNLGKDDDSLNEIAEQSFYYEDLEGNPAVKPDDMESVIRKLRLGVWKGSTSYGKLTEYSDSKYEMQFEFNGYPWENNAYGNPVYGGTVGDVAAILYGIEAHHSFIFEYNKSGNLMELSGFSYEVKERDLSGEVGISTYDEFRATIKKALNDYTAYTNKKAKRWAGDPDILYYIYKKFILENIRICYCQEIHEGLVNSFVPVVVLEGKCYNYSEGEDMWTMCDGGCYAISMESGLLYDWRYE